MNNDKNMKRRRRQQQQQKQKEQHMERDGVDETREEVSSSLTKVDQTHFCFSHFWPEILFFSVERNFFVAILTSKRCQKLTWTFLHLFRRLFATTKMHHFYIPILIFSTPEWAILMQTFYVCPKIKTQCSFNRAKVSAILLPHSLFL